ncbi:hypothetical protein [Micromonospora sp. WMMD737]|uniref:hypothetical protein n=1 Tax=Micromonospora sp. WMMD737 TaxID=3404113 RepID=UPI003B951854
MRERVRNLRRIANLAGNAVIALSIPLTVGGTLLWAPKSTFDDWWLIVLLVAAVTAPYGLLVALGLPWARYIGWDYYVCVGSTIALTLIMVWVWAAKVTSWAEAAGVQFDDGGDRVAFGAFLAVAPAWGLIVAWLRYIDRMHPRR